MPTAVSGRNDYYASPQRRQSSQSYSNLPSETPQSEPYSPDRPGILLPATTYSQSPNQARNRAPSITNNISRIDTSRAFSPPRHTTTDPQSSANPDDFYRQYSEESQNDLARTSLHQEALRSLHTSENPQSRVGSNGSYSTTWSADDPRDKALSPNIPGLRARKASVKNLVAQLNASASGETPPIPTASLPSNYTVQSTSPYLSSAHISQFGATRKPMNPAAPERPRGTRGGRGPSQEVQDSQSGPRKRPLFGEVLPSASSTQSAGYGILSPRRRTGSEGSPMHSPNPMFPSEQRDSGFVLSPAVYTSTPSRPDHRRINSDMPQSGSRNDLTTSPRSARRPPVVSRIPISTRRSSIASESEGQTSDLGAILSSGRRQGVNASVNTAISPKQNLTVREAPAGRITSPGSRGKPSKSGQTAVPQNSLQANIVVPPPKISPPLRSSRPRLPVSSASTAASRARMAEKFNNMQKLNDQKRSTQRRPARPPELTDIDLKARRLRITQALTRSRESEELKASFVLGKRWEPPSSQASSSRPESVALTDEVDDLPKVTVETDNLDRLDSGRNSVDISGYDRHFATRSALQAMHGNDVPGVNDDDSPTLGPDPTSLEKPAMHLQTNFLNIRDDTEPASALTDVTVETEATHIDPEPQENDFPRPGLLTQVMQMRDKSPPTGFDHSPRSNGDQEDRADVESVNLIFRNTAYLDEDEAISKGYTTNFVPQETVPEESSERDLHRDSWTSSIPEDEDNHTDHGDGYKDNDISNRDTYFEQDEHASSTSGRDECDSSYRDTMASDAYTIINIVLQQHSSSGIVDQQFADDVYQRVLADHPEVEDERNYDSEKIEQLCIQEIIRRDKQERIKVFEQDDTTTEGATTPHPDDDSTHNSRRFDSQRTTMQTPNNNLLTLPSTRYEGHRHKSSLDNVEDWASVSPSIGDWMRFAADQDTPAEELKATNVLDSNVPETAATFEDKEVSKQHVSERSDTTKTLPPIVSRAIDEDTVNPEEYGTAIIRGPSRSPPPPPKDDLPSIENTFQGDLAASIDDAMRQPRVPHRVTSLGRDQAPRQSSSRSRPPSSRSRAEITPWEVQEQPPEVMSPLARKLKQRKHVIKELVETEFTYERDMRVLCDIYKQTAIAALSEDDIRILFGNVDQVQQFARDFLTALKQTSKAAERSKDKKDRPDSLMHANSSTSTLASTRFDSELADTQKDRETRIGDAFEGSLKDMEVVYNEYIRNRHAANQRLELLQRSPAAQEWLKECKENSEDITNAWNLDALLVKPVQRITKYPLLLKELIDATSEDHPDLPTLRRVLGSITDINMRINEVKKHAEMLDQAFNRKRGQSDVRTGLSKAFGRRAEKLRQHVGITDMYEDSEYDKLRIEYDNNYVQLMVVANDCQAYEKGMTQWVNKMVEVAAAAEGWVDVGHSHHQQEESKLRQLAMIIRNVHNIALPDHVEHLRKKVIQPMTKTVDILTRFKDDPKGLLHKRDKRLVDYAQMKNRKDRGEKIDKKMHERMDQWEALNTEAKERMRKLLRATAHLVQTCLGHLVQLQMLWMAMIQQKFSSVMSINLNRLSIEDVQKDWQADFDFQEASALSLRICNGSLVLEAANMVSFLTPGSTTLNGDDSPHTKRSVSLHSETSTVPTLDLSSRPSGTYTQTMPESHFDRPYPYANGRTRAVSTASGKSYQRQPESSLRASTNIEHISASANFARPGTSPVVQQDLFAPPRLSVETHSPLMSSFQTQQFQQAEVAQDRPVSSATFFSAAAAPSQPVQSQRSRGSGVFSSAMPMSDSPVQERSMAETPVSEPQVLFTAASVYEFNIDRARREAGFPYLTYVTGEIFDVIGERGELWLAKNQDDPNKQIGWIWNKHFAKLAE